MASEFASVMSISIGGNACQLLSYAKKREGVYGEGGVRTATRITLDCQVEIAAANAAALASALSAFESSCHDGADVTITVHGSTIESISAAACIEGTPHISTSLSDEAGDQFQAATIHVEALLPGAGGGGPGEDPDTAEETHCRTAVNLEGLETVTWTGTIATDGDPAASAHFLANSLPARAAGWQRTYEYEVNEADTECKWTCTLTELVAEYPADGGNRVVDGERSVSSDYDEHNRAITRYSYSYVGPYADTYIAARHTALRAAGHLVSARISETFHKTKAVSGEFTVLGNRDGGNLLELSESVSHARSGPVLREVRYAGTSPLIVQDAPAAYTYTQAGRAIGLGQYPLPPAALFAVDNLADSPEIVFSRPNDHEFETAWRYRFLFAAEQDYGYPHGRAGSGGFY